MNCASLVSRVLALALAVAAIAPAGCSQAADRSAQPVGRSRLSSGLYVVTGFGQIAAVDEWGKPVWRVNNDGRNFIAGYDLKTASIYVDKLVGGSKHTLIQLNAFTGQAHQIDTLDAFGTFQVVGAVTVFESPAWNTVRIRALKGGEAVTLNRTNPARVAADGASGLILALHDSIERISLPDGRMRQSAVTPANAWLAGPGDSNTLLVGGYGDVRAYDASLKQLWSYSTGSDASVRSLSAHGQAAYFGIDGCKDGHGVIVALRDGKMIAERSLGAGSVTALAEGERGNLLATLVGCDLERLGDQTIVEYTPMLREIARVVLSAPGDPDGILRIARRAK